MWVHSLGIISHCFEFYAGLWRPCFSTSRFSICLRVVSINLMSCISLWSNTMLLKPPQIFVTKFLVYAWDLQVWSAYKDQKHDLFLPSNAQSAAAGIAGLIENSSSRLTYALTAPPPQSAPSRPLASTSYDANGRQDHWSIISSNPWSNLFLELPCFYASV